MTSPTGSERETASRVSKSAVRAMVAIVVVLLLVALYANVQRLRRDKIESVKFAPAGSQSPAPSNP